MTVKTKIDPFEMLEALTEEENFLNEPPAEYGWGIRHVQVAVMAVGTFMAYILRANLSVAIVAMVQYGNETTSTLAPTYDWGGDIQGYLLSSFFWGYFMLQIPAGIITTKFGGHHFICFAILSSSVLTVLLPQFAYYGGWLAVCLNRMIQGITQGFVFPSVFTLLGKWAPPKERSGFSSISLGAQYLGTVVATSVTGYMCSFYGWPSVFYGFGSVGVALAIIMWIFGANSPADHRMISEAEKKYIHRSLGGETAKMAVPWRHVLKSVPYWSVLVSVACQGLVFLFLFTKIPTYMQAVLHFSIENNGVLTAVPYLVSYLLTFVFSWVCSLVIGRNLLSLTAARKVFNSISLFGGGICIIMIAYTTNRAISVLLMSLLMGANAASFSGNQANFVDLAPNFSGAIFSLANFTSACLGLTGPLLAGFIITEVESVGQWRIVFFICAATIILANVNYIIFSTAETQWWNWPNQSPDNEDAESRRRQSRENWSVGRKDSLVLTP